MTPPEKARVTQADIAYWMGQVDGKLEALTEKIDDLVRRIEIIEGKRDNHNKPPSDQVITKPIQADEDKSKITFGWVLEKAVMPVGTAFLLWFLLTVLPDIISHLGAK